jgi:hypothetical protein
MKVERDDKDLRQENRQLKNALKELLRELEQDEGNNIDCDCVRDALPSEAPITPPWERDGYDSKEAWMEDN